MGGLLLHPVFVILVICIVFIILFYDLRFVIFAISRTFVPRFVVFVILACNFGRICYIVLRFWLVICYSCELLHFYAVIYCFRYSCYFGRFCYFVHIFSICYSCDILRCALICCFRYSCYFGRFHYFVLMICDLLFLWLSAFLFPDLSFSPSLLFCAYNLWFLILAIACDSGHKCLLYFSCRQNIKSNSVLRSN